MLACLFRYCSCGHDRTPATRNTAAPRSSKRQPDGLAIYPVSRQLVRRLLIEPPMSSGWSYGPDDPDQQDRAAQAGNQVATQVDAEGTQNGDCNRRANHAEHDVYDVTLHELLCQPL